jgi:subtilisin-like proprotein convertase family protein
VYRIRVLVLLVVITLSIPLHPALANLSSPGDTNRLYAGTTTFTNPTPITINDLSAATPSPSSISVAGLTGSVVDVNVTIYSFSHTCPWDVDILLVSPNGQNVLLLSDLGTNLGCPDAVNATVTFDDQAGSLVPYPPVTGTFRPTVENKPPTTLSVFNGIAPNGTWNLYVSDTKSSDSGSIAGGWSLTLTTADAGTAPTASLPPAPGPDMVPIPAGSVVGSFVANTPLYYAPDPLAATYPPVWMDAGKTLWVIGLNKGGTFYEVLLNGVFYWVLVETMGPNYDSLWNGWPLPTTIVE